VEMVEAGWAGVTGAADSVEVDWVEETAADSAVVG
jgi:hypothetical protein